MKHKHLFKDVLVVVFGLLALAAIWGGWKLYEASRGSDIVACTADAKLCPDGSAVGREGPNCEFAACPQ
ncbi:MAG: hypothetical protein AAB439_02275 [Patescibacteria group bacterium]